MSLQNLCTQLFTSVVIVVKSWKEPKCQMIGDREVNRGMSVSWNIYSYFVRRGVFISAGKYSR